MEEKIKLNRPTSRLYFIDVVVLGADGDDAVEQARKFFDPDRDEALAFDLVDGIEYGSEDKSYGDDYPAIVRVSGPKVAVVRAESKVTGSPEHVIGNRPVS